MNEGYNAVLSSLMESMESAGLHATGEGFRDIATDKNLFEAYKSCLLNGITDADDAANLNTILENSNRAMLNESSLSGIQPLNSLVGPMIRKLWPRFNLRGAVRTNIATNPVVTLTWLKPYMEFAGTDGKPQRVYLPRGLGIHDVDNGMDATDFSKNVRTVTADFSDDASAQVLDFWDDSWVKSNSEEAEGAVLASGSKIKYQPLDPVMFITSIALPVGSTATYGAMFKEAPLSADDELATSSNAITAVQVDRRLGIENNATYNYKISGYTRKAGTAGTDYGDDYFEYVTMTGMVILQADLETAKVTVIVAPFGSDATQSATFVDGGALKPIAVTVRVRYSSEYNEQAPDIGMETAKKDLRIGTGDHINAPLPIEQLQDLSAIYSLDGVELVTDQMTKVFAYRVDKQIYDLIHRSFFAQPGAHDPEFEDYPDATKYVIQFDVKPAVGYAAGPKAWREELKPLIDNLASRIKLETYLDAGIFTVVGNPLDVQLISNVSWTFHSGDAVDGVTVDYSVGTYQGMYTYKVIASQIVPQGWLYILFIPATVDQRTYDYWAYTFSLENGYRSPNRQNVPSVMMTKRDLVHAFLPAIGAIRILNNDASSAYDPFRQFMPISDINSTNGTGFDIGLDDTGVPAGSVDLGRRR